MNDDNEIVIEENTGNEIFKNIEVCDNCNVERIIIYSNCYNKARSFTIANNEKLKEIEIIGKEEIGTFDILLYLILKSKCLI